MKTIAVLGTGIMGAPIARNLAKAGFNVNAWNRTPGKCAALASEGVCASTDAREAVRGVDCVIVMLSTGAIVDDVLFGTDGGGDSVVSAMPAGIPVVVMSSIPVATARDQAKRMAALGHPYVDAPVSGGERGAIAGTLTLMAGGDAADVALVEEFLKPLGPLTHVGPCGCGQLAKLANQVIVGITIGAVAEALLLVEAGGGDPAAARNAWMGGFADSTILKQHGERMIQRNFEAGAHAHVQLKDLRTATELARTRGLELPLSACVQQLYEAMCAHGLSSLDHSGLFVELQKQR